MSKGIIVVDIPDNCRDCPLRNLADYCINEKNVEKYRHNKSTPDWCPIRPMPQKANHENYCDNGRYDKGWNECIETIGNNQTDI